MPLLRKKIFEPVQPPSNLKGGEKVFYCELTGEAFQCYDEFFQRMILCNSLVWSCERTGRHSLTYKEALECEAKANQILTNIPGPVKLAILHAVHNMKNGRIGDLANDVYLFLKTKPLPGEAVEVNINRTWRKGTVVSIASKDVSPKKGTPSKAKSPVKGAKMIGGFHHDHLVSFLIDRKPVEVTCNVDVDDKTHYVSSKRIRRPANELNRDVVKLFIRKCCVRSTINSDDGYWIVLDDLVNQHELGEPLNDLNHSVKSKKRKLSQKESNSPKTSSKKRKSSSETPNSKQKENDKKRSSTGNSKKTNSDKKQQSATGNAKKPPVLSAEQVQQLKEADRLKKLVKKEEDKEARRLLREKDREELVKIKQLEGDFLKRWNVIQEDLILEDSKGLPQASVLECKLPQAVLGDVMLVLEFLHAFGPLFSIKSDVPYTVDFMTLENGLSERNTDGTFYDILRFLLVTYLRVSNEENSTDAESIDSSDSETPIANDEIEQQDQPNDQSASAASVNATAIAAWPLLCQGSELHELMVDQFSLSEVLRMHLLSSGVRIGCGRFEWQKKGGFQYADDPGVEFRHKEEFILRTLSQGSVYDLPIEDKLKLLVLLCNQLLMLVTTREYIDDACENVRELKKQLRELRHAERKRKKHLAVERYKKKIEQRAVEKDAALNRLQKIKDEAGIDAHRNDKTAVVMNSTEPVPVSDPSSGNGTDHEIPIEMTDEEIEKIDIEKTKAFRDRENHLLKDLNKWLAVFSKTPLGYDRRGRSCWTFQSINGLYVEELDCVNEFASSLSSVDLVRTVNLEDDNENADDVEEAPDQQKLLSKISKNREDHPAICKLLMERYNCDTPFTCDFILAKSKVMKQIVCSVAEQTSNANPENCNRLNWGVYHHSEDVPTLIDTLNERGLRECQLKAALVQQKDILSSSIAKCEFFQPVPKTSTRAGLRSDTIDKRCFQSMDDFVEAALCEQLLDLEEKIWNGSLGVLKTDDRSKWRKSLDENIATLLGKGTINQLPSNGFKEDTGELDNPCSNSTTSNESHSNPSLAKLMFSNGNRDDATERCSTPTIEIAPNEELETVQRLANRLLQIEKGLERKFLTPPLGDGTDTDEPGRERACLERWEESLKNSSNLSQIFIHLNTLDRSITWNKSILNARCKLCRRKGDAEHMLLCDSCDRGFHMYCLKPPINNVPDGDWFCKDCQPKQIIRTPVKSKRRQSTVPSDDDEPSSNSESEEDDEEVDEDDKSDINDTADESLHGEICAVCGLDGTLVCCDMCPRVYHVSCAYPPMRKVPRGQWSCQVCSGVDNDLPKSKRVVTAEKRRSVNGSLATTAESKKRKRPSYSKTTKKQISSSSLDSSSSESKRRKIDLVNVTKKQIVDSSQLKKSRRNPLVFGRQERRICSKIIENLIKHDDAEPFVAPVDIDAVPDYVSLVSTPMDLGTIKRKANTGEYESMEQFLNDVKLVFYNCAAYNTSRSSIGKTGVRLRKFFESQLLKFELS